ncbi:putative extradiol dioxygenase [Rosellinia necatrix]|uniref:Putative extradiol dioxygenase n=1 Tax=Rosellinia necatrix TaxID=77044 RepID=A0A1W2TNI6_ROSNE|nr:putative extradiol dioxygenase [Rosellinia necatrix]
MTATRSLFQVTLVVDDYDRAKAYYCDVLGFECTADVDQGEGKRWVVVRPGTEGGGGSGSGGAALVLARAATAAQTAAVGNQTGGRVGFFLSTDDIARDRAALLGRGVRFLEEPRVMPYGTVVVFEDLYGNTWDLIQPVEG